MVAISNGRGIAIVDYELEVAAAGVLRRRLRVRLRFGFAAASLLSDSLLLGVGFAGVDEVLATAFADGLARPWSICNTPDSMVGDSAFFETFTSPAGCGWVWFCACWRAARSAARCSGVFGGV